jgi:hypothetical protein
MSGTKTNKTIAVSFIPLILVSCLFGMYLAFTPSNNTQFLGLPSFTSSTTKSVATTTTTTTTLASLLLYSTATTTGNVNKTEFILLNNLAQAAEENLSGTYMIRGAVQISSETNQTETVIHVWTETYSETITINATTAFILSHDNRCILVPIGPGRGWNVDSIYNYTNFPFPVTVYVGKIVYDPSNWGIIANNTGLPKVNYFVVGYVTNGLPNIIYTSPPNATIDISVSNVPPLNFSCA